MAQDANTHFIDGLRVTADHLQHLQDRLHEGIQDLRLAVGLNQIAWGLHAAVKDSGVGVEPGVAFASGGIRLNLDTAVSLSLPATPGPWRVVLRGVQGDRQSLRVGDLPTLITLVTAASIEKDDGSDPGPDAAVIASVQQTAGGLTVTQDAARFAAVGHHSHSGAYFQDAQGRWHYDGPALEGKPGPKGDTGPAGAKGDKGDPGQPGGKGDKGDTGDPGLAGAKGDKGDKGDAGQGGAKGDKGDPGVPGLAGAKGDKGDQGDAGQAGAKGNKGDKGDAGQPGAKGDKGDTGDPGQAGAKGDKGDTGDPGQAGAKGDKGDKGDAGQPGAKGDKGDKGDPGVGLDPALPFIASVSWNHNATVPPNEAASLLKELRLKLSSPLNPALISAQPNVIQVWYEPALLGQTAAPVIGLPIISIQGAAVIDTAGLAWRISAADPAIVARLLIGGGRMLIRVHCGFLFDTNGTQFSAALDAVARRATTHMPGGVFESWFFVARG